MKIVSDKGNFGSIWFEIRERGYGESAMKTLEEFAR